VSSLPGDPAVAVEPAVAPARQRLRPRRARLARSAAPYALVAPALIVIGAVLAYPIYFLVRLSFEEYGLAELIAHKGSWIGVDNYSSILHDSEFWHVLLRTVVFTAVNVGLTMVIGTLIALLLASLGSFMRLLLVTALVLAWAMPVVVAAQVWSWMVDFEFGVLNWTLTELQLGDFSHHDWFANPIEGFAVITALIVWGAVPFVAITLYAGLSQLPQELLEAASIDGAGAWRTFRDITLPLLKPMFLILTSLSIIWDFQVFNQVWLMLSLHPTTDYFLMSIYAYAQAFGISEYGRGAAIALVMVAALLCITFVYIRQMARLGEFR
jgi:N,N'-diacetylchitobiose transport system permease protein